MTSVPVPNLGLLRTVPTKDPRIRIGGFGEGNWRTVVQDEPGGPWGVTGPPYPSCQVAMSQVDDVLCYYFGDQPTRAQLAGRIKVALGIAQYVRERAHYLDQPGIDRIIRALEGCPDQPRPQPAAAGQQEK
jgi:hypothetical protein